MFLFSISSKCAQLSAQPCMKVRVRGRGLFSKAMKSNSGHYRETHLYKQ